ncbi:hypothetical protein ACPWT1_02945 [Ramlibacter sp. MMS24-I3-19]|uniref:hypothetical protein n=1 Tax=Ramlibacter sp. MMS24-I3-19 TaxID=3416606 RepID=UPI003D03E58D
MEKSEHQPGSDEWFSERSAQLEAMYRGTDLLVILEFQENPKRAKWSGSDLVKFRLRARGVLSLEIWEPRGMDPFVRVHHSPNVAETDLIARIKTLPGAQLRDYDKDGVNLFGDHMAIGQQLALALRG